MTDQAQSEALARELRAAYETGSMVEPVPSARPGFDLNMAYEVENLLKKWRESEGHKSAGRKVGYANKAMWRVLKLETLVWGHMYDDTVHYAENHSARLRLAHTRSLKVEPEIVFRLKETLAAGCDAAAALAATDWLAIGFEIIDCPYRDWKFQPSDFVASFGLHAGLVVGKKLQVKAEMIPQLAEELTRFKVRVFKSGALVEEGAGKNSLKSPALCLAELASAIGKRFPDEPLSAGELVSSGTLTAGHLAAAGDQWKVEAEGLALAPLEFTLT
jgi:2-keto-4-pentenoate hydratase